MTLFEKTLELAKEGYSVTIGDDNGYGIVITVTKKGILRISQAYSFDQLDLGIVPTEEFIIIAIDKLVAKLERRIRALNNTLLEGEENETHK